MTDRTTADAAEDFLDREHAALIAGDLDGLARLEPEREALRRSLSGEPLRLDAMERLRRKALRNEALLEASARGVRSALSRLAELRRAAGPIASYTASGGPDSIGDPKQSVERKA